MECAGILCDFRGSWGAQIGLAGIDNVLVFMSQEGMDKLLSSKFQVGGDLSAAVGPIGRHGFFV